MMKLTGVAVLVVGVIALGPHPDLSAAQTPDPAKVAAGKTAYDTQKCGTCHQIAGKGGKLAGALDDVGKRLTAADIKKWFTNPTEMEAKLKDKPKMLMSTFLKQHKLTDADVEALTAYMQTLK